MRRYLVLLSLLCLVLVGQIAHAEQSVSSPQDDTCLPCRSSFETSVIDPFFGIYFLRYSYQLTPQDELVAGFYYLYGTTALLGQPYPGSYQLYTPQIGYKRFLWEGLYAEYLLLPGFASYHDTNVNVTYSGFEI